MASVTKEITISAAPEAIWRVIADFADAPVRMAPGFIVDSRLDGPDVREVTFDGGFVARERLVTHDETRRRMVFTVFGGTVEPLHDNASIQVLSTADGGGRVVWTHDVLPGWPTNGART